VGRNPFGGFPSSAGFVADFEANGAGSSGFVPLVTCARSPGAIVIPSSNPATGAIRQSNRPSLLSAGKLASALLFMFSPPKSRSPVFLMLHVAPGSIYTRTSARPHLRLSQSQPSLDVSDDEV
jgi:hypothetical protein